MQLTFYLSNGFFSAVMIFTINSGGLLEVKEDLNENTYTNEAYKLYLNESKKEYTHQNTKVLQTINT